jgi:ribosomal protein L6P/L9E
MSNTEITVVQSKGNSYLESSGKSLGTKVKDQSSSGKYYIILKNNVTKITNWFVSDSISKHRYIKTLDKGFKTSNVGFVSRLILNGVGFKSEITSGNILSLRIGKKNPINYGLPESIFASVSKNRVYFWGPNETLVDNFVQVVLKKTPVKAGSLIYEKGLSDISG